MRLMTRLRWLCRRHPHMARLMQILALTGLWALGQGLAALTRLPIPGSVIALALLLVLMRSRLIPAWLLARGADWLLAEMLLFFVPAVMVLPRYLPLLRSEGLQLLGVILTGTVLVMVGSALAVDLVWRLAARRHARRLEHAC